MATSSSLAASTSTDKHIRLLAVLLGVALMSMVAIPRFQSSGDIVGKPHLDSDRWHGPGGSPFGQVNENLTSTALEVCQVCARPHCRSMPFLLLETFGQPGLPSYVVDTWHGVWVCADLQQSRVSGATNCWSLSRIEMRDEQ
jgi:hypothetical protein